MIYFIKSFTAKLFPWIRPGYWGSRYVEKLISKSIIPSGLFKGMRYVNRSICGNIIPKYLGVYEVELVSIFNKLLEMPLQSIIDVGAAEGYYAVGCALRLPRSQVIAFEGTEEGRKLLKQVIESNEVSERVHVKGYCTPEILKAQTDACQKQFNHLLIMDVEGAEEDLLKLHTASDLNQFYMLIELHDWVDPLMGERIIQKFSSTHISQIIDARIRQLSDLTVPYFFPWRCYLSPSLLAFSSERPLPMRWVYFEPKVKSIT